MRPGVIAATCLFGGLGGGRKGRVDSWSVGQLISCSVDRWTCPWNAPERSRSRDGPSSRGRARASSRAISAARLNASPRFHLRPIDVLVWHGPLRRPHLGESFALRCFQRLSQPDAATRRCGWRHNRCTVGPSDPVLSY